MNRRSTLPPRPVAVEHSRESKDLFQSRTTDTGGGIVTYHLYHFKEKGLQLTRTLSAHIRFRIIMP